MSITLSYFWGALPKVFLLLHVASLKAFSCLLGGRNTAHTKMLSDLVTPSSCSCSRGLPASLQTTWLFGGKLGRSRGSLCLEFSVPLLQVSQFLGTGRKKASMVITMSSGSRQNKVQSWLCHFTLCNYRQVANPL